MSTNPSARRQWALSALWALIDCGAWVVCSVVATWFRYDLDVTGEATVRALMGGLAFGALHVLFGMALGPYAVGHDRGSFEEIVDLARAAFLTAVVAGLGVWLLHPPLIPKTVPITAGALAIGWMFALRFVLRAYRRKRAGTRPRATRVIVFGAGEGGRQLLRTMLRSDQSEMLPVALLDDDPRKGRLRLDGVRVRGTRHDVERVAAKYGAETLAIAVPSAESSLIRDLSVRADEAGLDVLVLPSANQILGPLVSTVDLRDLDLTDLLGRRPVSLDTAAVADQISGRRVLVTGAGGSIGSELCRQLERFGPATLFLLDRDESALQATQLSLSGSALLDGDEVILADIRDLESMRRAMERARPEIVFHAAALKHLPLLESYPLEAWKTNVLGTLNVLKAAAEIGVRTVVNISTDKAADPICVLGYSKRLAERLTAHYAHTQPGQYVSVRFGNVLGSRGSVVPAFTAQIQRGGPITVTHPEVERYFMLIPEACQLVMEASALGHDGDVMVLDMGEPVKIVEVARTLVRMSKRQDIDIVFSGLRPGEKLGEELFSAGEVREPTGHDLVSRVGVPALDEDVVLRSRFCDPSEAVAWMRGHARPYDVAQDVRLSVATGAPS